MRQIRGLTPALIGGAALAALGIAAPQAAHAQATVKVDINKDNSVPVIPLSDGTQVLTMEALTSTTAAPAYRYLPLTPRLVKKPDGTPVFLFASYNKSKRNNDTGADQVGGILNFSMTYGLDAKQLAELEAAVKKMGGPNARLAGPILVKPEADKDSFFITSATLSSDDLTRKVITTGKAPLFPGSQVACAARLTGDGAQIFEQTLKNGKGAGDLAVSFNLAFDAMLPAVDATIVCDWSRLHANRETYKSEFQDRLISADVNAKYSGVFFGGSANANVTDRRVSKQDVKAFYDYLREKNIVRMEGKVTTSDPVAQKYLDAFFTMFMERVAKKESPPDPIAGREALKPPDMSHLEKIDKTPAKAGSSGGLFGGVNVAFKYDNTQYRVKQYTMNNTNQRQTERISLKVSLPIRMTTQITGNIAQFYNQAKDNPKCVIRFYLDDPFFQKFDVLAPINVDSPESFSTFANYVTVTVRKKRGRGQQDFADSKTFTRRDMTDGLPVARFSYAGGDTAESSRDFEYAAQWGLRNGKVWPDKPTYQKSSLEGINVNPPLVGKVLELVGDTGGMQANNVIRVAAQVRFLQLGEEKEINTAIGQTNATEGVKTTIYCDQEIDAYIYRITYFTSNGKRLSTDWIRADTTGILLGSIPDDLMTNAEYLNRPVKPVGQTKDLIIAADQALDAGGGGG
jgi:hypothetical protein